MGLLIVGCNGQEENSVGSENEDLVTSVEDAVTTLGAVMDDQEGEAYATQMNKSYPEMIEEILFPKAYAANCVRPVNMACNSGVKTSTFSDCSIFGGLALATGTISLDYSQNDCSMAADGDSVNRTYRYEIVGPRGGQLEVSSADNDDYSGDTIGGGATLTNTVSGWELDILGKHKVFTRNGRERMNKSIKTLAPLEISGGIRRANRRVNNGQLQVSHNLAEFKAIYTAQDLRYSSSCCHPVSGSMSVEYTGSISGTATVEFNSCGSATLTNANGETSDVRFTYCE